MVRRRNWIHGRVEPKSRTSDRRMAYHPQPRPGGRQAGACERNPVDLGATVSAVPGETQRPAVLWVLPGAHDRNSHRIALGVVDGLVVNRDAHAWSTVANPPFAARLCGESFREIACETTRMTPLTFHREALGVAQQVVDVVDCSAAFAGRRV